MSFEEYLKDEQDEKEEMDLRVRSKVEMMLKNKTSAAVTEVYHSQPCKYRLPCGRCDKTDEMCIDFHFVPLGVAPVIVPDPSEWDRMNKEEENKDVKYSNATDYATDASYTNHT